MTQALVSPMSSESHEPLGHALVRARAQLAKTVAPVGPYAQALARIEHAAAVHPNLVIEATAQARPLAQWRAGLVQVPPQRTRTGWFAAGTLNSFIGHRHRRKRWGRAAGVLSMLGAAFMVVWLADAGPEPRTNGLGPAATLAQQAGPQALQAWGAAVGAGPAFVVRKDVPQSQLVGLGMPFDPARAHETVRTEWLLNPQGRVLAVRLAPGDAP